ncbi:hypothetical protein BABINDRAFT_161591, partial [Babjeviella inositovora NRRL Y-12698]
MMSDYSDFSSPGEEEDLAYNTKGLFGDLDFLPSLVTRSSLPKSSTPLKKIPQSFRSRSKRSPPSSDDELHASPIHSNKKPTRSNKVKPLFGLSAKTFNGEADDPLLDSISNMFKHPLTQKYNFDTNLAHTLAQDELLTAKLEKDRSESQAKLLRAQGLKAIISDTVHEGVKQDKQWNLFADNLFFQLDEADAKEKAGEYSARMLKDVYLFNASPTDEVNHALEKLRSIESLYGEDQERAEQDRKCGFYMSRKNFPTPKQPPQLNGSFHASLRFLWGSLICDEPKILEGYRHCFLAYKDHVSPENVPLNPKPDFILKFMKLLGCNVQVLREVAHSDGWNGKPYDEGKVLTSATNIRGNEAGIIDHHLAIRSYCYHNFPLILAKISNLVEFTVNCTRYDLRTFCLLFQITCLLLLDKRLSLESTLQDQILSFLERLFRWFIDHNSNKIEADNKDFTEQEFKSVHNVIHRTSKNHPELTFRILHKIVISLGSSEFKVRNLSKWLVISHINDQVQFEYCSLFPPPSRSIPKPEPMETQYLYLVLPFISALLQPPSASAEQLTSSQRLKCLLTARYKFILMLPLLIKVYKLPTADLRNITTQLDACFANGDSNSIFYILGGGMWLGEVTNCKIWVRCVKQLLEVELLGRKVIAFDIY